ncbi:D-alanyl-D-alanine carboxypeptidase family protein [Paenibacillus sp. NPDC058071]|uniref:M15 family metallopeptidase n=1 Tax=Paenibacillus sp. NPDC058071 TaxID=3346326 RepID=UPI0036DF7D34
MNKKLWTGILLVGCLALTACGAGEPATIQGSEVVGKFEAQAPTNPPVKATDKPDVKIASNSNTKSSSSSSSSTSKSSDSKGQASSNERATVAKPESITALVNKQNKLPEKYVPKDLVYPDVKFTFNEKIDKRKMRKEAAEALEKLFAAAKKDGKPLAGVSAYRSHERQKQLFNSYVKKDGLEKAMTYSAFPGTSEHETGLAIDVAGADGKCSATDCFADKPEAKWLAKNAHKYGFIIRYPKGKEKITGYKYEPWHLRYVGTEVAAEIYKENITLEEYWNAVPVSGKGK